MFSLIAITQLAACDSPIEPKMVSPATASEERESESALEIAPSVPDAPNIVLILVDDVGTEQLGAYGSKTGNTPNLDALAKQGIVLTRTYGTPKCQTSRAELITGTYPFHMGFGSGARRSQDLLAYPLIPKILGDAGYDTAIIGKWHLSPPDRSAPFEQFGFQEFHVWHRKDATGKLNDKYENARIETREGEQHLGVAYTPDALNARVREFLGRKRERPFFLYYPSLLAHHPMHTPPGQTPVNSKNERFAQMIHHMDALVGHIMDTLRNVGREHDTLLIFLGDNGSPMNGKGQLTESGTRLPSLIRWPGVIESGRKSDALIDFSDFLPTLAEAAGVSPRTLGEIDGQSFLAHLMDTGPAPREWVFSGYDSDFFVRNDRWKLDSAGRLFDLQAREEIAGRIEAPESPESALARSALERVVEGLGLSLREQE
jgi:arylsulfatase A